MKKMILASFFVGAIMIFAGCEQDASTANKSQQEQKEAVGYVEKLMEVHEKAPQEIADAINKENSKLEEAKKIIEDENKPPTPPTPPNQKQSNNNSQKQSKIMNNIPEQINMELAKTCKSATLKTNKGDLTIEFYNNDAPVAVANFCTIADKGDYDNVIFHRVIKGFMIQGGDPDGTGFGGPDYEFDDEIHANNKNNTGTIALANSGPGTNGSQFFINTNDNNFLDTKHTVFGKVINGMDVVTAIEEVETGAQDKPVEDVVIENIELEMN